MNENKLKLKRLIMDTFLLEENEFNFDLRRDDIDSWDSLGIVSVAVSVNETFGYHFTQNEAMNIKGIQDIITLLETKGISFK